ncbi:unnamed protein product [Hydatigera taeniaeformis]|uniref:C2H2-type domain-containing protein n=1 Tax=Hydatigena taeniaeformis TaxID=6205 RepID=A0A0R3WMX8_HYDTA|nr:unnamed protein product [Hydatigera taeniaeformis]
MQNTYTPKPHRFVCIARATCYDCQTASARAWTEEAERSSTNSTPLSLIMEDKEALMPVPIPHSEAGKHLRFNKCHPHASWTNEEQSLAALEAMEGSTVCQNCVDPTFEEVKPLVPSRAPSVRVENNGLVNGSVVELELGGPSDCPISVQLLYRLRRGCESPSHTLHHEAIPPTKLLRLGVSTCRTEEKSDRPACLSTTHTVTSAMDPDAPSPPFTEIASYVCDTCGSAFKNDILLRAHLVHEHQSRRLLR